MYRMVRHESSLIFVSVFDFNLLVAAIGISRVKPVCFVWRVDTFIHTRNVVRVSFSYAVLPAVLYAKVESSVLLERKYNGYCSLRLRWFGDIFRQHFIIFDLPKFSSLRVCML